MNLIGRPMRWLGLIVVRLIPPVAGPLSVFLVIKSLGESKYGVLAGASGIIWLIVALAELGINQGALNRFVLQPAKMKINFLVAGITGIIALFLSQLLLALLFALLDFPNDVKQCAILMSGYIIKVPLQSIVSAYLQATNRLGELAVYNFVATLPQWSLPLVLIFFTNDLFFIAGLPSIVSLVFTIAASLFIFRNIKNAFSGFNKEIYLIKLKDVKEFIGDCLSFYVSPALYEIYRRSDRLILPSVRPPEEVGHYNVANSIVEVSVVVPQVTYYQILMQRYLAVLSGSTTDVHNFAILFRRTRVIMNLCCVILNFGIVVLLPHLSNLLFDRYDNTFILTMTIMLIGISARFIAIPEGMQLTTRNTNFLKIKTQVPAVLIAIIANLLFAGPIGIIASAVIFSLVELFVYVGFKISMKPIAILSKGAWISDGILMSSAVLLLIIKAIVVENEIVFCALISMLAIMGNVAILYANRLEECVLLLNDN